MCYMCLQDKMVEVTKEVLVEVIKNVTVPGSAFFVCVHGTCVCVCVCARMDRAIDGD